MTTYELEQYLNALYKDLDRANGMDEETACKVYRVDCKSEIIEVIEEEIETCKTILKPAFNDEDDGMDYDALCEVQGLSRYA